MRSLKYLAALLPLHSFHALANRPESDVIIHVTSTRTITVCPITDLWTCEPDFPTEPPVPATTTKGGNGGWGSNSGSVATTTSKGGWGDGGSGSTSKDHEHPGTSTGNPSSTTGSWHYGNGTTTTGKHSTASGSLTTTSHTTTSKTTSTGSCTATVSALALSDHNGPETRSKWGRERSVNDDTHKTFRTGRTVEYVFTITAETIDFDGTPKPAFAINGKTPGEPIVANWGDIVQVTIVNGLKDNATTIHWHGIRQVGTNDQDGVPGVTECGIAPGGTRVYTWHASTYGTGWYHSHALAQYGGGIRGPIIIHGPATANYDYDLGTVMIDETFSQTIFQLAYNIARRQGPLPAATNYLLNGKNLSPDGTKGESSKWIVKKGKKHLFRIINSSAQSGFAVRFDYHKIKVISADFTPIVPYDTEVLWIQPGQRYNVILEANQAEGAYYLRAVSQTGCGANNLNNGLTNSNGVFAYEGACGTAPITNNATIVTAGVCNDEPLANLVPHVKKDAGTLATFQNKVKLLPGGNAATQNFAGYGNIIRWYLGGGSGDLASNSGTPAGSKVINVTYEEPTLKTLAELPNLAYNSSVYGNSAVLDGPANEWVYFVIQNNFQTSHPMHLHGHDFSVLGQGRGVFTSDMVGQLKFDNPIRRDTALLFGGGAPGAFISGWTVIGFQTDNPGAWVMHCHLIWHADGGMGLQYLERPSEIKDYYNTPQFKQQCAAYEGYVAGGGQIKHPYEAGVKRRHLDGHKSFGHSHGSVVRH